MYLWKICLSNLRYFRIIYIQNQITCGTVAVTIFFILSKSTHYCHKAWCNEVGYQNCPTELNEFWFASGYVLMWTLRVFLGILILIVWCSLSTTLKDWSNESHIFGPVFGPVRQENCLVSSPTFKCYLFLFASWNIISVVFSGSCCSYNKP